MTVWKMQLKDADVINVLRIQLERMKSGLFPSLREYARIFGLNKERLALAKKDVLILHPGPMNKGVEISPEIAYGLNSAIQDQVQNGVAGSYGFINSNFNRRKRQ